MAYDKQAWESAPAGGTPINHDRLNHIEDGIEAAAAVADTALAPQVRTSAQILSAANTVNTVNKVQGRIVFDSTLNKPLWASGSTATSTWRDATGSVIHTPV